MSAAGSRVGIAARAVAVVAVLAGGVMIVAGVLMSSTVVAINGVVLLAGTVLVVGVTYAAVFAREDQLTRRASSRRG
jgi:hypothetical protein